MKGIRADPFANRQMTKPQKGAPINMTTQKQYRHKRLRFAIYTRYSSELQNELSLEAQESRCRRAIAERKGKLVAVFSDEARSGWSLEREGFQNLCRAAELKKFDAIMFWKFDRLARHHNQAVMIKMLLRQEYGLKLHCVEGFSEDEDNSPYSAMMEQMLAIFSAFYSQNLSSETKRGKYQRASRGEFNGSVPPLGYVLVKASDATAERPAGLYIILRIAAVVRRAFKLYATGKYSDLDIASWLNQQPIIQKLRDGLPPISKDAVRDMLQNRVYTGRVPYAETIYNGSLGERKQSSRQRKQWFEGKHQGFISDALFDRCQQVRQSFDQGQKAPATRRTYLLKGRVYCMHCISTKAEALIDQNFGKMGAVWLNKVNKAYYRCRAKHRGYPPCTQKNVPVTSVDAQVLQALRSLVVPTGWQSRIEQAVRGNLEHAEAFKHITQIEETIKRIDFSWEQGFLAPQEYVSKRTQLYEEIESLLPVDYDALVAAVDILETFGAHWQECANANDPEKARQRLLGEIVDKVFVSGSQVTEISLKETFRTILNGDPNLKRIGNDFVRTNTLVGVPTSYRGHPDK
ncbi:MAG: recombinase family protein [Ardenticatenaceae bacterium]|nr:recombinase family protein [Anaerolineales bacterium]MCB9005839.1 recombinase family protein [Ardenticatenaceae bacterium]